MSTILQNIDLFGTRFNFTIFKKQKFTTTSGGIFTIMSLFLIIVTIIIFGRDFYMKTNPKVITSTSFPSEVVRYPITSENYTFIWRFEDINANEIPLEELAIYPNILYQQYKKDESTNMTWMELAPNYYVNYTRCTLTEAVNNPDLVGYDLNSMYCLDWEKIGEDMKKKGLSMDMGGSWTEDYVSLISFTLNTCPQYDMLKPVEERNCSSYQQVVDNMNKQLTYLSLYYPNYYFDPNNYTYPFQTKVEYRFWLLNPNLVTLVHDYFAQDRLIDDRGWIFEAININYGVTIGLSDTTYQIVYEKDYVANPNTMILSYLLYFTKESKVFNRSYMKLQDLAAVIGGFIKIVLIIFQIIIYFISRSQMNEKLINEFFEYCSKEPISDILVSGYEISNKERNPSTIPFFRSLGSKGKEFSLQNSGIKGINDEFNHIKSQITKPFTISCFILLRSTCCRLCISANKKKKLITIQRQ